MFPFYFLFCNKFCTSIFMSLVLYEFLMLITVVTEEKKIVAFKTFES